MAVGASCKKAPQKYVLYSFIICCLELWWKGLDIAGQRLPTLLAILCSFHSLLRRIRTLEKFLFHSPFHPFVWLLDCNRESFFKTLTFENQLSSVSAITYKFLWNFENLRFINLYICGNFCTLSNEGKTLKRKNWHLLIYTQNWDHKSLCLPRRCYCCCC